MNLCIVSSGDFFSDYGGGQVYVRNVVDAFIAKKQTWDLQISVISCPPKNDINATKKDYFGIPVYEISPQGDIKSLLYKIHPDIVHANGEKLVIAKACKNIGIPCVVTAHHGGIVCPAGTLLDSKDRICNIPADYIHCLKCYLHNTPTGICWYPVLKHCNQEKIIRFGIWLKKKPFVPFLSPIGETGMIVSEKLKAWKELAENATHFIAPSNAIAEALKRNGCPTEKITIIPHGIPFNPSFNPQLSTLNSQHSIFYYVGRINYVKGIHLLLKAFSEIKNNKLEMHLIGGAVTKSEKRYMKHLQRKYRFDHRIIWHGKIPFDQLEDVIKDFQCLVHPAIYLEVFGLNISEALVKHKYIIATRCGGPEMQIHNESEGLLVNPNDSDALKNALSQYISNPRQSDTSVINMGTHVQQLLCLFQKVSKA